MDWNVKLCIQPAAAGFVEDLNSIHPYSTSYTGTAFIMLSWHESAELEGGESGERGKNNTLTSELVVEHMQLLPLKGKTERRLKADVN